MTERELGFVASRVMAVYVLLRAFGFAVVALGGLAGIDPGFGPNQISWSSATLAAVLLWFALLLWFRAHRFVDRSEPLVGFNADARWNAQLVFFSLGLILLLVAVPSMAVTLTQWLSQPQMAKILSVSIVLDCLKVGVAILLMSGKGGLVGLSPAGPSRPEENRKDAQNGV